MNYGENKQPIIKRETVAEYDDNDCTEQNTARNIYLVLPYLEMKDLLGAVIGSNLGRKLYELGLEIV